MPAITKSDFAFKLQCIRTMPSCYNWMWSTENNHLIGQMFDGQNRLWTINILISPCGHLATVTSPYGGKIHHRNGCLRLRKAKRWATDMAHALIAHRAPANLEWN